jgi:hypothetical protein
MTEPTRMSADRPDSGGYACARLVSTLSLLAIPGIFWGARHSVAVFNRISNTARESDRLSSVLVSSMLVLACVLLALSCAAALSQYRALRLAGRVSIGILIASVLITIVPLIGLILPELLLYVPAGFFAAATVRVWCDSLLKRHPARLLVWPGPVAALALSAAVFLSVLFGKIVALSGAKAFS